LVDIHSLKSHLKFPVIAMRFPCSGFGDVRGNGLFLSDIRANSASESAAKCVDNRENREICPRAWFAADFFRRQLSDNAITVTNKPAASQGFVLT
jgi:hypothetical protein